MGSPGRASDIRSVMAAVFLALGLLANVTAGCGNECRPGESRACGSGGTSSVNVCTANGEFSTDCFPEVSCNPLTQERCGDGEACYLAGIRVCLPLGLHPCEPSATAFYDRDGDVSCHAFCDLAANPDGRDEEHCRDEELCSGSTPVAPQGIGVCAPPEGD